MPKSYINEEAISVICHTSIDHAKSSLDCDLKHGGKGYTASVLRECLATEQASGKPRTALIKLIESHIARREKLSQSVQSASVTLRRDTSVDHSAEPESQTNQLATQLTDQYRKAISGTRDILVFGAMMLQLPSCLSRQTAQPNQHTADTIKSWIAENCPEINYKTACSFLSLARGLAETLALPARVDLPRLLSAPVADLSKHDASLRAKVDEFLEGKSKRQLEFDFGIRAPKRKSGGNPVLMLWLRDKHPELADSVGDVDDIPANLRDDYEAFRQEYLEAHSGPQPKPLEYYQQRWAERITAVREFVIDKEEFRKLDEEQLRTGYQALKDCLAYLKKNCNI